MIDVQNILIARYGEIALKGMNRPFFERTLLKRIRKVIAGKQDARTYEGQATARLCLPVAELSEGLIIVRGYGEADEEKLAGLLLRVFGVATVSPAWELPSREQADINRICVEWIRRRLGGGQDARPAVPSPVFEGGDMKTYEGQAAARLCPPPSEVVTFKVFGKRADKSWPVTSPEIAAAAGAAILEAFGEERRDGILPPADGPRLKVDVTTPDIRLHVHLRRTNVLIYEDSLKGFGGLPLGTNGKGLVLLSGGIDSPVAAWMMAKRGMMIEAVHFHSYPYTSKRAEEKVKDLADVLASYMGRIKVHILNILPAQEALAAACPEEEMTILTRRFMMRIASRIAEREDINFLITGENLGQVASQTAEGIAVTDRAAALPVLRPLIAHDKVDIMELAQRIETYEISIQPYEDCCTVFLPKHPVTRPELSAIEASEAALGADRIAELEAEILASDEVYIARF